MARGWITNVNFPLFYTANTPHSRLIRWQTGGFFSIECLSKVGRKVQSFAIWMGLGEAFNSCAYFVFVERWCGSALKLKVLPLYSFVELPIVRFIFDCSVLCEISCNSIFNCVFQCIGSEDLSEEEREVEAKGEKYTNHKREQTKQAFWVCDTILEPVICTVSECVAKCISNHKKQSQRKKGGKKINKQTR